MKKHTTFLIILWVSFVTNATVVVHKKDQKSTWQKTKELIFSQEAAQTIGVMFVLTLYHLHARRVRNEEFKKTMERNSDMLFKRTWNRLNTES